jgi:hypothetical protein
MKLFSLLLLLVINNCLADAFCSLRDPVSQINTLYPSHESYLSFVKKIDNETRKIVQENLPNNDLHFGELGQHTLYVVIENQDVVGYVHVRSEQSDWGLVEIVWAIDSSFRVVDFTFQRCRSPEKVELIKENFKQAITGRDFEQLKQYLAKDGISANQALLGQINTNSNLVNVVLRCALKTLLLTKVVWHDELQRLVHLKS